MRNLNSRRVLCCVLNFMLLGLSSTGIAQVAPRGPECGSLENAYGPFDYTNAEHRNSKLSVVERHHFDNDVYALRRGITGQSPLGDIDYTLRAFPNHHLALDAMARLHEQQGVSRLPSGRYSLACWFERARRFNPDDGMVSTIYGVHLARTGHVEEAKEQLTIAADLNPSSAEVHYNLGLVLVRLEEFDLALRSAHTAYSLGYPLPGLKNQLERAGEWRDPLSNDIRLSDDDLPE